MRATLLFASLFCFASFGWAMVRHFDRAGKPKPGMVFTGLIVPVFAGLNVITLLKRSPIWPAAGLVLYVAAGILFWLAIAATRGRGLAACFQCHVPRRIVWSGPYRFIRHPFYSAYTLVWLGGFAATGWWPLGAIAVFMAGLYEHAARKEEAGFLQSCLGPAYQAYMHHTGRFFPRLGKRC